MKEFAASKVGQNIHIQKKVVFLKQWLTKFYTHYKELYKLEVKQQYAKNEESST